MIEIDGSVLEGGGQILRIALCVSCLCKIPIKVKKIRAGRSKPGLAAQHLKGIDLLKQISNATVKGDNLGSTEIEFIPYRIKGGKYIADIKTAGSVSLLLQAALPVAYFADGAVTLVLKGGTNADMAPQIDFMTEIFRPNLEKFGVTFDFELYKRGYFPKGGGHIEINLIPTKCLEGISLIDFGEVSKVFGWSFVANNVPMKVANEMSEGSKSLLKKVTNGSINVEVYKETSQVATENCSGIIIGCETSTNCIIGGSALGNRNESPYESGRNAAQEILNTTSRQACLDDHTQDQLIIFMALSKGKSRIKTGPLTLHTKTAIFIIEKLIDVKFSVIKESDTCIIECIGIGLENKTF